MLVQDAKKWSRQFGPLKDTVVRESVCSRLILEQSLGKIIPKFVSPGKPKTNIVVPDDNKTLSEWVSRDVSSLRNRHSAQVPKGKRRCPPPVPWRPERCGTMARMAKAKLPESRNCPLRSRCRPICKRIKWDGTLVCCGAKPVQGRSWAY